MDELMGGTTPLRPSRSQPTGLESDPEYLAAVARHDAMLAAQRASPSTATDIGTAQAQGYSQDALDELFASASARPQ
eukprot:m.216872 g.216872  ORF g.216872 m.216872 type:complete len:77 (-) comp18662_c0_seq1:247-477(-)